MNQPALPHTIQASPLVTERAVPEHVLARLCHDAAPVIVRVQGDAMAPLYPNGCHVLVATAVQKITAPAVYAAFGPDGFCLMRMQMEPGTSPPIVRMLPENSGFARVDVPLSELSVCGMVVARLDPDTWEEIPPADHNPAGDPSGPDAALLALVARFHQQDAVVDPLYPAWAAVREDALRRQDEVPALSDVFEGARKTAAHKAYFSAENALYVLIRAITKAKARTTAGLLEKMGVLYALRLTDFQCEDSPAFCDMLRSVMRDAAALNVPGKVAWPRRQNTRPI